MHRVLLTSAACALAFFFALAPPAWAAWVWPLNGQVVTAYSNGDDPYAAGRHRGIDIAGEIGQPVVAAAGGSVRFAGTAGSSGLTVSIRTIDGLDTSYLHLSSSSVREGQVVRAGERIGAVGISGTRSTERPHLHFGVREAGTRHAYRDPLAFLPALAAATPDGPNEAPVPQPAPAPVPPPPVPVPAPVPNGERAPARRAAPIRRRAPASRRAVVVRPAPRRAEAPAAEAVRQASPAARPASAPRAAPGPAARPATRPDAAPRRVHRPEREPLAVERAGPAAVPSVSPSAGAARGSATAPPAGARADRPPVKPAPRGPDVGFLLACTGLLGAAALLGLSEDGRAATRRTGQRAAGLLAPLLSRR